VIEFATIAMPDVSLPAASRASSAPVSVVSRCRGKGCKRGDDVFS